MHVYKKFQVSLEINNSVILKICKVLIKLNPALLVQNGDFIKVLTVGGMPDNAMIHFMLHFGLPR